ncbi:hypothetical protein ACEQ8H_008990, partial [Pleosporales sp. CAS-2024a]
MQHEIKDVFPDHKAAQRHVERSIESLQKTGYGRYLVSLRTANEDEDSAKPFSEGTFEHIGLIGLHLARLEGVKAPEISDVGFNFLEQYHRKGYATEA